MGLLGVMVVGAGQCSEVLGNAVQCSTACVPLWKCMVSVGHERCLCEDCLFDLPQEIIFLCDVHASVIELANS